MFLSSWLRKLAAQSTKSLKRKHGKHRPSARNRLQPWLELFEERAMPAIFTVNTLTDPFPVNVADANVSLRDAITLSNTNGTASDTITFNIPGAPVQTFQLNPAAGVLPTITGDLAIDGTTQAGYTFGVPALRLDGSLIAPTTGPGLNFSPTVGAVNLSVFGFEIINFRGHGIQSVAAGTTNNITLQDVHCRNNTGDGINAFNVGNVNFTSPPGQLAGVFSTNNTGGGLTLIRALSFTATDSLFDENLTGGVRLSDVSGNVTLTRVTSTNNDVNNDTLGNGFEATDGTDGDATAINGALTFNGCVFGSTDPSTPQFIGVYVQSMLGAVTFNDSSAPTQPMVVENNTSFGVFIQDGGTTATFTRGSFSNNGTGAFPADGIRLGSLSGAASFTDVTANGNFLAGLVVDVAASFVDVDSNYEFNGDQGLLLIDVTTTASLTRTILNTNGLDGLRATDGGDPDLNAIGTNLTMSGVAATFNGDDGIFVDGVGGSVVLGDSAGPLLSMNVSFNSADGLDLQRVIGSTTMTNGVYSFNSDDGIEMSQMTGAITMTGVAANTNTGDGINLFQVGAVTTNTTTATGNDRGIVIDTAASWTDTAGNFSNNVNGGAALVDISGNVTLVRTTLDDNGGDGLNAIDSGADGDPFAIGGNLLAQGIRARDNGGATQQHGVFVQSIQGSVTFNDSTGPVQSNLITGNQQRGVTILDGGTTATFTNGSYSNNGLSGIRLISFSGAVTMTGVTASNNNGGGAGLWITDVGSFSDTDGAYVNNESFGILLEDVAGNVALTRTTADDNDADGFAATDFDGNNLAIGGSLTVSGGRFRDTAAGGTQQRGVFVASIAGAITFNDSTGVVQSNIVTGNQLDGVLIGDGGTTASFTNGTYSNNGDDGIEINSLSGAVTMTGVTANDNVGAGIELNTVGAVTFSGVIAGGNATGAFVNTSASFSDTAGAYVANHDHGVQLIDVAGNVTLVRTTADNNDANFDFIGHGVDVTDGGDPDGLAIGGNLTVSGGRFRDTNGLAAGGFQQTRGIFVESVAGSTTFNDSTGTVQSNIVTGNLNSGVGIVDGGTTLTVTNGTFSDNGFNGIHVNGGLSGAVTLSGVTTNNNVGAGILLRGGAASFSAANSTHSGNADGGLDVEDVAGNAVLTNVTARNNDSDNNDAGSGVQFIGGGLAIGGNLTITGGSFSATPGNEQEFGILVADGIGGNLSISGVTVTGNDETGAFIVGDGDGTVNVATSTFSTNGAEHDDSEGDGVHVENFGGVTFFSVTTNGNFANGIHLLNVAGVTFNSVIAGGNGVGAFVEAPDSFADTNGLYNANNGYGIALTDVAGNVTLTRTTSTNNDADSVGGGDGVNVVTNLNPVAIGGNLVVDGGTFGNAAAGGSQERGIFVESIAGSVTFGPTAVSVTNNASTGVFIPDGGTTATFTNVNASDNGGGGIFLVDFSGAVAMTNVVASRDGNASFGLAVFQAASFTDTDGTYNDNGFDGVTLANIAGDVTLTRTSAHDNDSDQTGLGNGIGAGTVGGSLTVLGGSFGNSIPGGPQEFGIFVQSVGGNTTFGPSTGLLADVTVSGNTQDGVRIDAGAGADFTGGAFVSNGGAGIHLNAFAGGINMDGVVAIQNGGDGATLVNVGPVVLTGVLASDNDTGVFINGAPSLSDVGGIFVNNLNHGIELIDLAGSVTLTNTTADNNDANDDGNGDGISAKAAVNAFAIGGNLTVTGGSFSDLGGLNDHQTNGIFAASVGGDVTLDGVGASGNEGAGVFIGTASIVAISNSTTSNNEGAGVFIGAASSLAISNSTASNNDDGGFVAQDIAGNVSLLCNFANNNDANDDGVGDGFNASANLTAFAIGGTFLVQGGFYQDTDLALGGVHQEFGINVPDAIGGAVTLVDDAVCGRINVNGNEGGGLSLADGNGNDIVITNFDANNTGGDGIFLANFNSVRLTNVIANFNAGDGFQGQFFGGATTVIGGSFSDNGDNGVDLFGVGDVSVNGTTTSRNQGDGIVVNTALAVTVTNVTSTFNAGDGFADGLEVTFVDSLSIVGGTFSNNEDDGIFADTIAGNLDVSGVTANNNLNVNGGGGLNADNVGGTTTITGGTFNANGSDGIDLSNVGPVITTGGVVAMGNDPGINIDGAVSYSDTNGNFSANNNGGIRLQDIGGDVTLNGTTANNNDADNDGIGDGLTATASANPFAIGGNLTVTNASFQDTTGIQINGVFVASVAGTVSFTNVLANGNQRTGVRIDNVNGSAATFTGGSYANNGQDGISLANAGLVTLLNLPATGNGDDGITVDGATGVNANNVTAGTNGVDGVDFANVNGPVTITNSTFNGNGTAGAGAGVHLTNVTGAVALSTVVANANNTGVSGTNLGSFSDTNGNFIGNRDGGIVLGDVTGDLTLLRTIADNNDADNDAAGDGLSVTGTIGGNLLVRGGRFRRTVGVANHQQRGVFVANVGGTVTFNDSPAPVFTTTVTGNESTGLVIANGGTNGTFTNGNFNSNLGGGISLNSFSGTLALTNLTANNNGNDGINVGNSNVVNLTSVLATNNAGGGDGFEANNNTTITLSGGDFSNNTGDGIDVTNATTVTLGNLTANSNAGQGMRLDAITTVNISFVTNSNNGGDGFSVDGVLTLNVSDFTGLNNGSGFGGRITNVTDFNFTPTTIPAAAVDLVDISPTQIQHTRNGSVQQPIAYATLTNMVINFGAGNDVATINPGAYTLINLTLNGDAGIDTLTYNATNGNDTVGVNGLVVTINGQAQPGPVPPLNFTVNSFEALGLNLLAGNDTVTVTALPTAPFTTFTINGNDGNDTINASAAAAAAVNFTINGDAGNDLLLGSQGVDVINGGDDNDTITGNQGNDVGAGDNGNDLFVWNEGDGSDTLDGNLGNDTVQVNGTNVAENFTVTPAGARVNVTRTGVGGFTLNTGTMETVAINGNDGNDTIAGSNGLAALGVGLNFDGGPGNDILTGGDGADVLTGGVGADTLTGGAGNDALNGGADSDTYVFANGGLGSDVITEANGNVDVDVLTFANFNALNGTGINLNLSTTSAQTVNAGNLTLTITGATSIENVIGTAFNDLITGNDCNNLIDSGNGNDNVVGGIGNDTLTTGAGADTLTGGAGNDALNGGAGGDLYLFAGVGLGSDVVTEAGGNLDVDVLNFNGLNAGITFDMGSTLAQVVNAALTLTLSSADGIENLVGSGFDDLVTGNVCDNNIDVGAGNDVVSGNVGNDTLIGGTGNDNLAGDAGNDNIDAGIGSDTLTGGTGNDTLSGGADSDTYLFAGALLGSDLVVEAGGPIDRDVLNFTGFTTAVTLNLSLTTAQVVSAGNLTLTLSSATGIEDVVGSGQADSIIGNTADNVIDGGAGNDTIDGGTGNDTITGGLGADSLLGGIGNDLMNGGDGNDILVGGPGADVMNGGNDNDLLIWNNGDGSDVMNGDAGSDTVQVNGADTAENFTIAPGAGGRVIFTRTTAVGFTLDVGSSELLDVNANGGDDTVTGSVGLSGLILLDVSGGLGNDLLTGGDGPDLITGNDGNDTIIGARGNDTLFGGNDNDLIIWNNGDGSDVIEGDAGTDEVEVNGGAAAENFTIEPNGARVVFARITPGFFALDIGTSENYDVNGFAGDDTFTATMPLPGAELLDFDGGDDNDLFVIDMSTSNQLPTGGINYDGGAGANNQLLLRGGPASPLVTQIVVTPTSPTGGNVRLDGQTVTYANVNVINDLKRATELVVNGTAGVDRVTIGDGPVVEATQTDSVTSINGTFTRVNFANATNLTFNGQAGADRISLNVDVPAAGLTRITLNGNDGADAFLVAPSTTLAYFVNGDAPVNQCPGDRLDIDTTGVTNANLNSTPGTGNGTWTFNAPHQTVTFTGIEDMPARQIVVVGRDFGVTPRVDVFDALSQTLLVSFNPFASSSNFKGGARVAAADVNGDCYPDIIVGQGPGGPSNVRVYDGLAARLGIATQIATFRAYGSSFRGGVHVAGGDLDGDGRAEIITGFGGPAKEKIRVFNGANIGVGATPTSVAFTPFGTNFTGGATVAVGDYNGDGQLDVIAAAGPTDRTRVKVWNGAGLTTPGTSPSLIDEWVAFDTAFRRGLFVTSVDLDGDGSFEVMVARNAAGITQPQQFELQVNAKLNIPPIVQIFSDDGTNHNGSVRTPDLEFQPYPNSYKSGVRLGSWADGGPGFLLTANGGGVTSQVKQFDAALTEVIFSNFANVKAGLFVNGSKRNDGLAFVF